MTGMLADLVNSVADEFRTALGAYEPANDEGEQLFDRLRSAGLLDIPDLVALLLRHAEEEHISAGIRAARGGAKLRFLQSLVSDEDLEVSAAAMALILAIGRRRDRFGGPRVAFDDISAEAATALVNAIAAGLREGLLKRLTSAEADEKLVGAVRTVLAQHDESNRLEARLFDLVHALDRGGRVGEALIRSALEEGEVALLVELLGRSAGIGFDSTWEYFAGEAGNLALLLRMSNFSRTLAGEVVARVADVVGSDAETEIVAFDALTDEQVDTARKWLRLDPTYRIAIEKMGRGNG